MPQIENTTEYLTADEAAALLGVTESRIRQLVRAGRLDAMKRKRAWWIVANSVEQFTRLPAGRPTKQAT